MFGGEMRPDPIQSSTARKPLLVVEDDPTIRENLQELLHDEGYTVRTAPNGKAALESLREHGDCGLVLLDLQMPVMTGEQLLDALAHEQNPAVRDVPVLVLTARAEGLQRVGIVGLIKKPIDIDHLLREVRRHCG